MAPKITAGTRKLRISRLTEVDFPVSVEHLDGQAEQHHVAADLGDDLRDPQDEEASVAQDLEGLLLRVCGDSPST